MLTFDNRAENNNFSSTASSQALHNACSFQSTLSSPSPFLSAHQNTSLDLIDGRCYFPILVGSRITLKEALETIQEVVGKDAKITYEGSQKGDMRHTYADISKARKIAWL